MGFGIVWRVDRLVWRFVRVRADDAFLYVAIGTYVARAEELSEPHVQLAIHHRSFLLHPWEDEEVVYRVRPEEDLVGVIQGGGCGWRLIVFTWLRHRPFAVDSTRC
jgi:hypothetical protein